MNTNIIQTYKTVYNLVLNFVSIQYIYIFIFRYKLESISFALITILTEKRNSVLQKC